MSPLGVWRGDSGRPVRDFAVITLLLALPLLVGFWLMGHTLVQALAPGVELFGRLFGVVETMEPAEGGWRILTGDRALSADRTQAGELTLALGEVEMLRIALSLPFFLALMLAPPRAPRLWLKLAIGVVALVVLCGFSGGWVILARHMVEVNQLDWGAGLTSSGAFVETARYPGWMAYPVELGDYLVMAILPLAAPVVTWLVLNPDARALLLSAVARPIREDG